MPLGKFASNTSEDRGSDQVQMSAGPAAYEPVQKTILKTGEEGRSEAAAGEERMRGGFSYGTRGLLSAKGRTGQQRRSWGNNFGGFRGRSWKFVLSRSMRISVPFPYARISTASLSICSSVRPDLRLMIFKSCADESVNRAGLNGFAAWRGPRASGETNSVGDAVRESHELNLVAWALPVRVEGENEAEGGCLRVCWDVGEGDVSQSRRDTVDVVGGAHGGGWVRKGECRDGRKRSSHWLLLNPIQGLLRPGMSVSLELETA